jgi:hypothetical protein
MAMSMVHWLLNLLFGIVWNIGYVLVRGLILMRRWLPPGMLLIVLTVVPLLGFSLPYLDRVGSYLMVGAAIALAFIAGKLSRNK